MSSASASRELRKGILLRLSIAIAVLVAVTLAWRAFDESVTVPEAPRTPVPRPQSAGTLVTPPAEQSSVESKTGAEAVLSAPAASAGSVTKAAPSVVEGLQYSEGIIRTLPAAGLEEKSERAEAAVAAPMVVPQPTAKAKLPGGPYLQVGVFMHPANAAELKARLEAEGMPVVIATRVQVGPFKSKQEAEAMRAKLKAMGMESLLINR